MHSTVKWALEPHAAKKLRNTVRKAMHDVCYDVEFEPPYSLLENEIFFMESNSTDDNAHFSINANGQSASIFSRTFCDKNFYSVD